MNKEVADNLAMMKEDIDKNKSDVKFIKLSDGDKIVLEFDPAKVERLYKYWNGQTYLTIPFADYNPLQHKNYDLYHRFNVKDPNMGNMDRILDVRNKKFADTIISHLLQEEYKLKIKRIGSSFNTVYDVEPTTF